MTVTLQHVGRRAMSETSTVRARYVVGCDGVAQRDPRTAIGRELSATRRTSRGA